MTDWISWIFVGVGGSLMKEMDQGWLQWSYGFLEAAWEVWRVIGWAISLEKGEEDQGVYSRESKQGSEKTLYS